SMQCPLSLSSSHCSFCSSLLFFFSASRPHRHLHSFPTRRSSDLTWLFGTTVFNRNSLKKPIGLPSAYFVTRTGMMSCQRSDAVRSEEHTSELQSRFDLVCRLLLEKKKKNKK